MVSNNSPLFVFCRYQIKCKSVSNNSPRYKQNAKHNDIGPAAMITNQ
ncbi:hypothetical protein CCG04_003912 [Salmonella enterica subsp. enterica serovar 6,7:-:1,5]|nr:hypothetical protein [Salmonella enterica subsp. enterica serovar 6,7:-:1,5]